MPSCVRGVGVVRASFSLFVEEKKKCERVNVVLGGGGGGGDADVRE